MRASSVADALIERRRAWLRSLTADQRVQLALQLGEESLKLLQRARGVTRQQALAHHRLARQEGRAPSLSTEVEVDGAARDGH